MVLVDALCSCGNYRDYRCRGSLEKEEGGAGRKGDPGGNGADGGAEKSSRAEEERIKRKTQSGNGLRRGREVTDTCLLCEQVPQAQLIPVTEGKLENLISDRDQMLIGKLEGAADFRLMCLRRPSTGVGLKREGGILSLRI